MSHKVKPKKSHRDPEGTASGDDPTLQQMAETSHKAHRTPAPAKASKQPDLSDVLMLMQQQMQQQQLQMQQQQQNFQQILQEEKEHRRHQQEMHEANQARVEQATLEAQRQQAYS